MAVSIVLMALPYGVPMTFDYSGPPDFETITRFYSYFSGMPFGYGFVLPIVIALLTVGIFLRMVYGYVMAAAKMKNYNGTDILTMALLFVTIVLSCILLAAPNTVSLIEILVPLLHAAALALQCKRKDPS